MAKIDRDGMKVVFSFSVTIEQALKLKAYGKKVGKSPQVAVRDWIDSLETPK
jgi:hypothetical protein